MKLWTAFVRPLPRLAFLLLTACGGGSIQPGGALPDVAGLEDPYAHSLALVERVQADLEGRPKPLFDRAEVERRFGFDDRALAAFERALERFPDEPRAHELVGFLHFQQDRLQQAESSYRQALKLEPSLGGVRTRLGLALVHQGRVQDGIDAYEMEMENGTASAETHHGIGQALVLQGEWERAAKAFRRAASLDPTNHRAWYGLFQAAQALGLEEEAEEAMARFREHREETLAEIDAQIDAQVDAEGGGEQEARAEGLLRAAETYADVSRSYQQAGYLSEAHWALECAVALAPTFRTAWIELMNWSQREGDLEAAVAWGERAVEALPEDPELLYLAAGLHIQGEDWGAADALLRRGVRASPENALLHRELAKLILLHGTGQPAAALEHAQRAAELERSPPSLDVLAWALFQNGDREAAVAILEEALELSPDNVELRRRLESLGG